MRGQRSVRLFGNGRHQAVRIPRDLELPGTEALIHKEGKALPPLRDRFPEIEELPIEPAEIEL